MADGHWATICPTCRNRYKWDGPLAPTPPCPKCKRRLQTEQAKAVGQSAKPAGGVRINHEPSESAQEAFDLCDEIEQMAGDACEAGEEFAGSVCERTTAIRTTIEQNNRASDAQITALENMRDGLARWIHD